MQCERNRTVVEVKGWSERVTRDAGILSLGSCFSMEIGNKLAEEGYGICSNPFGVLYNPASIANSIDFLAHGRHHGSFARQSPEEFLSNANASLATASSAFKKAGWLLVTFGTSWVYRHIDRDIIVSNCHKHPAWEFRRELLTVDDIVNRWSGIVKAYPDKRFVFTVSPIRHKQISKAILLLAVEHLTGIFHNTRYFPAYEIVLDELRDYAWYSDDQVHPSKEAVNIVWKRFMTTALDID